MRLFSVGLLLSLAALMWLVIAGGWGESPFGYSPKDPWYQTGSNLNTVLFHAFSGVAHAVLGAGIAVAVLRRK